MPLPTVYAYTDRGSIMEGSRWEPHKVLCTSTPDHTDRPGILYAVKFCTGRSGAAAMISEVVCAHLFRAANIPTLDVAVVRVSESFAASWNGAIPRHSIEAGSSYFGTVYRTDVGNGPPLRMDQVEDPQQLIDIWVMDSLVCNLDRGTEGNALLIPARNKGKFRVMAADQSDCFCGSESFCAEDFRQRMAGRPSSEGMFVADAIGIKGGRRVVGQAIDRAVNSLNQLDAAFTLVPEEWWALSGIQTREIALALRDRADRLATIVNLAAWGEFDYGENVPIIQL
jgi:HipA-like kinase